ncbi:bacterial transcription activator, effector binding domain protein [delta proteobacterium NaphS2]|nr:bacterial transcription activator, effector binding domain protein [delta proteobacterium NaphS2]
MKKCAFSNEISDYEYLFRLNRTIDYIHNHLGEDLNLTSLARIACFSKYHFHRIFSTFLSETVNEYVRRVRLEKAVRMLTLDRDKSVLEIALDCGFSSSQNFAKAFKSHFGVTPTYVRTAYNWGRVKSKLGKGEGLTEKECGVPNEKDHPLDSRLMIKKIIKDQAPMSVRVAKIPDFHVAYVRSIGPYRAETIQPAFDRLMRWAIPRELMDENTFVIGAIWNDPNVTPAEKCIYDACITVPKLATGDGKINIQRLRGGKFAVYHCDLKPGEHQEAWMKLIIHWLLSSAYLPDNRPFFEIMYNFSGKFPLGRHALDLCLPVKPS